MHRTIYVGICILFLTTACTQQSATPDTQKAEGNYTSIALPPLPDQEQEKIDPDLQEALQKQQREEDQMSDIAKYMRYQDERKR